MSNSETFLTIYPYICFVLMNAAIIAVLFIPNKYCDTKSINKTWVVIALVLGGLLGTSKMFYWSLLIFALLIVGIAMNYMSAQKRKARDIIQQTHAPDFKRIK